jgi:hypothetical protein
VSLLHTVLLSFEPGLSAQQVDDMYRQVRAWPDEIGGFEELAVGPPLFAERVQGYQYLLHIVVADVPALERYLSHPVHQRFVSWVREHGARVLAFDYLLDGGTVITSRGSTGPA